MGVANGNEIVEVVEDYFISMLDEIDEKMEYQVAVIHDDRWAFPLPDMNTRPIMPGGDNVMIVAIAGWTREVSHFDIETGTLYVRTAFGEEENYATFNHAEVLGILDMAGNLIYAKTYIIDNSKSRAFNKKGSEKAREEKKREGIEQSMSILMKNNPSLVKKGGKDGNV
jgi:hypothetical protein